MMAQLVMNQVLLINRGNNDKLPNARKLKIPAAHGRNISMQLPCQALIASNHLDADAIVQPSLTMTKVCCLSLFAPPLFDKSD
jgi:hypothetical protein